MSDTKSPPKAEQKKYTPYFERPEARFLKPKEGKHWARMDFWELWEALLLVTGFRPRFYLDLARARRGKQGEITEEQVHAALVRNPLEEASEDYSPDPWEKGADQWWDMFEVLLRSNRFSDNRVSPPEFVAWAKEKGFIINEFIDAAVQEVWGALPRWGMEKVYTLGDDDNPRESWIGPKWIVSTTAPASPQISSKISSEEQRSDRNKLLPKERDSLLKLVIGMALEQYGYDPNSSRGDATANIETDLRTAGVPLDRGTILKWLRAAATMLPPKGG